jgi:hypothetical protein
MAPTQVKQRKKPAAADGEAKPTLPVNRSGTKWKKPMVDAPRGSVSNPRVEAAHCCLAVLIILLSLHGAQHMLAPQMGEWFARLCQLPLLAATFLAGGMTWAIRDHPLAARESSARALGWWAVVATALLTRLAVIVAGKIALSPGLVEQSVRITDTQLVLRCMAMAMLGLGPLFASLGFVASTSAHIAVVEAGIFPWLPVSLAAILMPAVVVGRLLLRPLLLLILPKPACTTTAVVAVVAAMAGELSRGTKKWWGGGLLLAAGIAAAGIASCYPCSTLPRAVRDGSMYTTVWSCEARRGGLVQVVEGILGDKHR